MNQTSVQDFRRAVRRYSAPVHICKGWFEDTLAATEWPDGAEVSIAYVDCDYCRSTGPVLEFLSDKLAHGAILAFDDWNAFYGDPFRGQRRAFREFSAEHREFLFEPFLTFGTGQSFICLKAGEVGQIVV